LYLYYIEINAMDALTRPTNSTMSAMSVFTRSLNRMLGTCLRVIHKKYSVASPRQWRTLRTYNSFVKSI